MNDHTEARQLAAPTTEAPAVAAPKRVVTIAEEQLTYARLLDKGMKLGILFLIGSFAIYVSGVMPPLIPVDDLPKYWGMPVKQYLAATGIHAGWGWVTMVGKGDFLNFIGIAFLAGITLACYAAIIPGFLRKKDMAYAWIAIAEIAVLALAASGVLRSGGH